MNVDPAKIIESVGENLPIKEFYRDALHPAAEQTGIALGTLGGTLRLLLIPFELAIYQGDRIREKFMPDLERRLSGVPQERIQSPPLEIAGPVIEALRFTSHNDDLRQLFANLLGTAMDAESAHLAHPSYVELLKQLTPDEARIVQELAKHLPDPIYVPTISIASHDESIPENSIRIAHFSLLGDYASCQHHELILEYTQNLIRLGLLTAEGPIGAPERWYPPIESHPFATEAIRKIIEVENRKPRIARDSLRVTEYGRAFLTACVSTPASE